MTNCCSCLEIQTLWRWGILFETNSTVHHSFCSPPQTVPWLLFPRAVHWHVCLVGRYFLHSNQASAIVTFLPLTLNSLGAWHTVAVPLVEQKSKGEKENNKLLKFVSAHLCHCDWGNSINKFLLLLPRKQPYERQVQKAREPAGFSWCFYQPALLFTKGLAISRHILNG